MVQHGAPVAVALRVVDVGSNVHALRCVADAGTDRDRHVICWGEIAFKHGEEI